MWHLNKQIYHCNTVVWILFYIRALRKDLGYVIFVQDTGKNSPIKTSDKFILSFRNIGWNYFIVDNIESINKHGVFSNDGKFHHE
jgi:hypothetical protein